MDREVKSGADEMEGSARKATNEQSDRRWQKIDRRMLFVVLSA